MIINADVNGNIAVPILNHKGNFWCELNDLLFIGFSIAKERNCDVITQIVYRILLFWRSGSIASIPNVVVMATIISESEIVIIMENVSNILFINFRSYNKLKRKIQVENAKNKKGVWTNVVDESVNKIQRVNMQNMYVFAEIFLLLNFEKNVWLV